MKGEGSEVMSLVRTFLDGVVGLLIQGDFLLLWTFLEGGAGGRDCPRQSRPFVNGTGVSVYCMWLAF